MAQYDIPKFEDYRDMVTDNKPQQISEILFGIMPIFIHKPWEVLKKGVKAARTAVEDTATDALDDTPAAAPATIAAPAAAPVVEAETSFGPTVAPAVVAGEVNVAAPVAAAPATEVAPVAAAPATEVGEAEPVASPAFDLDAWYAQSKAYEAAHPEEFAIHPDADPDAPVLPRGFGTAQVERAPVEPEPETQFLREPRGWSRAMEPRGAVAGEEAEAQGYHEAQAMMEHQAQQQAQVQTPDAEPAAQNVNTAVDDVVQAVPAEDAAVAGTTTDAILGDTATAVGDTAFLGPEVSSVIAVAGLIATATSAFVEMFKNKNISPPMENLPQLGI